MAALKILVVEDKHEEQRRAHEAIESTSGVVGTEVGYYEDFLVVANHAGQRDRMGLPPTNNIEWGAVVTDMHFPWGADDRSSSGPLGFAVVAHCQKLNIPCIVCTDADGHHIPQWYKVLAGEIGVTMITNKDWKAAVEAVVEMVA